MEGYVNKSFKDDNNQTEETPTSNETNDQGSTKRDARCGYLCWEPDFLQRFNNAACSCLWLCLASFFQGLFN